MRDLEADSALEHGTARRFGRLSWGGIIAGFFVGVGMLFLLLSLGAAVGLTSVNPRYSGARNRS